MSILTLDSGKIIGIIGPNGAGKSTLLKAMMGLIKFQWGTIQLFGEKINNVRKKIELCTPKRICRLGFPCLCI